jgi:ABC-type transporter Mla maintaining outer membrane lipid asymmetry ATPase subunit MlaF
VEEKLDLVGMAGSYDLYPSEISGGMRKRVSLARAIISESLDRRNRPNILLYDEPTAGLDPVASTRIQTVIMELLKLKKACGQISLSPTSTAPSKIPPIASFFSIKVNFNGLDRLKRLITQKSPYSSNFLPAVSTGRIQ